MKIIKEIRYSGKTVLSDDSIYYYVVSKHTSLPNAKRALEHSDLYYFGKTVARITKQGKQYWIVMRLNVKSQRQMRERLPK